MTTATTPSGLEIALIRPERGAKYSPNLFRWLTASGRPSDRFSSHVFQDPKAQYWIGYVDGRFFVGSPLSSILSAGEKAGRGALPVAGQLTHIEGFWDWYVVFGRCAFDPTHRMHFAGDDTRWKSTDAGRQCQWCGEVVERRTPPSSGKQG